MLKKILSSFFSVLFLLIISVSVTEAANSLQIYFFYGTGCPHCSQVEEYFEKENIYTKYPVIKKEIYFNKDNALLFNTLLDNLKILNNARGVPTVVLGDKALIGDKLIIDNFINEADKYLLNKDYFYLYILHL